MGKKIIALCLCLLLLFSLSASVFATANMFFVAVNDTVPLTLSNLPTDSGGVSYVPYTVFNAKPGNVVPAYSEKNQTFILFTKDKQLLYRLDEGTVTDESGNVSTASYFYLNGVLYIPLNFCASHFGLKATLLTSRSGYPVLRFTTGSEIYDDALFLEKVENLIVYRVVQAQKDAAASQTAQPSAAKTTTTNDETKEEEKTPAKLYLAIENAETMQQNAKALESSGLAGTFFLTKEEIEENTDLVRELYLAGHLIGLTVSENEQDIKQALDDANNALDKVLNTKTLLVLLDPSQAEGIDSYRIFVRSTVYLSAVEDEESYLYPTQNVSDVLTAYRAGDVTIELLRETSDI